MKIRLINRKSSRFWLLALGIAVTPLLIAKGWAEAYSLDSVDFASKGDQTSIILHTGSIVPVDKVLVSDTKLILDIDNINTDDTIQTNFSGADNISNVIMQPLSDHKVRMIIRGESLGQPSVAFYTHSGTFGADNPSFQGKNAGSDKLDAQVAQGLKNLQDGGMQNANLTDAQAANASIKPANDTQPALTGPVALTGLAPDSGKAALKNAPEPSSKSLNPAAPPVDTTPLSLTDTSTTRKVGADLVDRLGELGKASAYLPYALLGLLGILIVGIGAFAWSKIAFLRQNGRELAMEDLAEAQADGRPVGFREMASAYRNRQPEPETAPAPLKNNRKPQADGLIGLRGLKNMDAPEPAAAPVLEDAKATGKALESLIASMQAASQPKLPIMPSAPKKQVVNQYLKNQQPKQNARQQAAEQAAIRQRELQRAQEMQSAVRQDVIKRAPAAPVNRAPAAQKRVQELDLNSLKLENKPGLPKPAMAARATNPVAAKNGRPMARPNAAAQGPLPGNPEVLSFLRNVAELMEKDGKTDIAKSIHKNLSTQNLGTV